MLETFLRNSKCRFYGKVARYEHLGPQKSSIICSKRAFDAPFFATSKAAILKSGSTLYIECYRTLYYNLILTFVMTVTTLTHWDSFH